MTSTIQGMSTTHGHRVYPGTHEGVPMRAILKAAVAVLTLATLCTVYNIGTERSQICTVTDTDPANGRHGQDAGYRIHTDCGTFAVGALFRGPWDTKGLYQSIEPGETYTFTTVGWDLLSQHPAVIHAEPTD